MTDFKAGDRVMARFTDTAETRVVQALAFLGVWLGIVVAVRAVVASAIDALPGVR